MILLLLHVNIMQIFYLLMFIIDTGAQSSVPKLDGKHGRTEDRAIMYSKLIF